MINKIAFISALLLLSVSVSAQNVIQKTKNTIESPSSVNNSVIKGDIKSMKTGSVISVFQSPALNGNGFTNPLIKQIEDSTILPLSPNGKLLSVDGFEVEFRLPDNPAISSVCGTKAPYIVEANGLVKSAGCPFNVPCDNPANRDAASTTVKYFQLEWHIMQSTAGGPSSNINQTRVDQLMAELNADYATHNMVFCADPANFYVDDVNYDHNSATEEVSLKTTYVVNPTQLINIYVVGTMAAGGYARFPYDPMGGTSNTGGIVLNRGNCNVGTHTLAHEMGHTFGLEHTFAGVDERSQCSACYEQVRNVNGSSNASGVPTPFGGPYNTEGDQEGDWCSDTNPHDTYSYNCFTSSNPNGGCDTDPWANAPVNNHMSYSFCTSQFTLQQRYRQHCMTTTYLGSWIGYGGGICGSQPPNADFQGSPTTWQAPAGVTFTDLSQPTAIITQWDWTFDVGASGTVTCAGCVGPSATFTGQVPPLVTYPNPGLYTVSLTVMSGNGNDTETKVDYIEVLAPSGDCDTLDLYWLNPAPNPTIYGGLAPGEHILCVPDLVNSPTNGVKGAYEQFITPNVGVTEVGAILVGLAELGDANDNMVFQVSVYDDDGGGLPGAFLGGSGTISPTAIGVPLSGSFFYQEYWVPFTAVMPTTTTFHVGIEVFPGDLSDELVLVASSSAGAEGQGNGLNHIWSEDFAYENLLAVYGLDIDLDLYPMLGGYAPRPLITGYTENPVCDTTYVTLFDTVLYSTPTSWSFTFADGTVITSATDPMTIDRVYTIPGPDTVTVATINACGRGDTTTWIIPYNFLTTPDSEFSAAPGNPVCAGAPGVTFTANTSGHVDYTWDFGDGSPITSSGNVDNITYIYPTPGLYYVELTVQNAGIYAADTFYLEDFEGGWPAGYARFDNDPWTPDPAVNPPFTGTNATAWLPLDIDGSGDIEAVSTSWNLNPGELADDWMCTSGIGVLPANQRLFWDAEALDPAFPDGYEVRISTTGQLPANAGNYSTVLFSIGAENAFNTTHSVDLSSYAGQTVYIAFVNNSDWMYLLSIDNIKVGTATPGCTNSTLYTDYVEVIDCSVVPPSTVLNADVQVGCAPLTVTFTDATIPGPDPATSWLWNFGDATFSMLQNPPPHLYGTPGTYFVIFESCNTGGCTQDTITITVGALPTITSAIGVDPSCAGNDGTITVTGAGGTGSYTYSIDNGATFQASNFFGGLIGGSYDVIVQDAIGCQSTVTTVVLNPPLIPNLVITDPAAVCAPGTVNLTLPAVTVGSDAGALTYWTDPGATIPLGGPASVSVSGTYYIQLDNGSCTAIGPVNVTINPMPNLIITDPAAVCSPSTVDLTAPAVTAGSDPGTLSYWTNAAATISLGSPSTVGTSGTYYIQLVDGNGCSVVQPVNVVVNPLPTLIITDPAAVCAPNTVDLTAPAVTAGSSAGTLSYWTDAGATIALGSPSAVGTTGTYYIQLVDGNGCSVIQPVNVTVNPTPTLVIADPAAVCSPGTVNLTLPAVTAGSSAGTLSYWTDAGATIALGSPAAVGTSGTYYIQLVDGNGCSDIQPVNVIVNPLPNLIITDPAPVCTPGTVDLTAPAVTAGSDPGTLTYWVNAAATISLGSPSTVGTTGTYYIQLVDGNGCSVVQPVNVVVNPLPTLIITDPAAVCAPGTVDLTAPAVTAGSDPGTLTYWTDAGATIALGSPAAVGTTGTYYIQLVDGNGCSVIQPVNVTVNPIPTLVITDPAAVCAPSTVDLTLPAVTAGSDPGTLSYWTDAGATIALGSPSSVATTGTYYIQLVDGNGCSDVQAVNVVVNPAPTFIISGFTDPTVCGASDGTFTISGLMVSTGYSLAYLDDGSPIGPLAIVTDAAGDYIVTGLNAGSYTNITISDGVCFFSAGPVTLTDPAAPTFTLIFSDPTSCGGSDGSITIQGLAATTGYSLTYTDDGFSIGPAAIVTDGAGDYVISGLDAGSYTNFIVDLGGCIGSNPGPVNLSDPTAPNLVITDPAAVCSPATVDLTAPAVTAGSDPGVLTYWSDAGATVPLGSPGAIASSGTYYIQLDVAGCTSIQAVNVTINPLPTLVISDPAAVCSPGTVNLTVPAVTAGSSAGTLSYWTDAGATIALGSPAAVGTSGTYYIQLVDGNGCSVVQPVNVTVNPLTNLIITDPAPACAPNTVDLTAPAVSAGSDPGTLSYWVNAAATISLGSPSAVGSSGTYYIQLVDGNGCSVVQPVNVVINPLPTLVITDPASVCAPGTVDLTAPAVTAGSSAGTLSYWTDAGATIALGSPAAVGTSGTYYIQLVDGNGCSVIQPVNVIVNPLPTLVITDPAAVCSPGTVNLTVPAVTAGSSAGTLSYWTDAGATIALGSPAAVGTSGTYYIQLVDGNGCSVIQPVNATINPLPNLIITDPAAVCAPGTADLTAPAVTAGSDPGTLSYWTNAAATISMGSPAAVATSGTYYIQLVDGNGCSVIQPVNVVINPQPTLIITDPAAVCAPGTVDLTAAAVTAGSSAGTLSYWTDAGATIALGSPAAVGSTGTYYIELLDGNGCSVVQAVNVTVNPTPNLVITDPAAVCSPGTVNLTVPAVTAGSSAGSLSYWTDAGATIALGSPAAVGTSGTYYIQLTSAGCSSVQPVNVVINPLPVLTITDPAAVCSPGTVDLTAPAVTVGSDPGTLTYWTDAGATIALGSPSTVGTTGTYYIQLVDGNGCSIIQSVNVVSDGPTITNVITNDPACGATDGDITINASGGTGALQYSIDNGIIFQAPNNFNGLGPALYNIVVEDANGCSASTTATLVGGPSPIITVDNITDATCFGDSTGSIDITVTGGTLPFTYDWDLDGTGDNDDAEDLVNAPAGTWTVTVTDSNGCTATASGTVNQPPAMVLTATTINETLGNDGTIDLTVSGGVGPFLFDWDNDGVGDNDDTEDQNTLIGNATYTVIVTDQNGCTATFSVFVGSVVGTIDLEGPMGVAVYPNPNTGEFNIVFANYSGEVNIDVTDVAGRLIYRDIKSVDAGNTYPVSLNPVASGVYYLLVKGELETFSVRIVKE